MALILLAHGAVAATPDSQVTPASYTTGKSGGQLKWMPIHPADGTVKQAAAIEDIVPVPAAKQLPLLTPTADQPPPAAADELAARRKGPRARTRRRRKTGRKCR